EPPPPPPRAGRPPAGPAPPRLYLPKSWADDPARRQKAQVPEDVTFQTKPEIGLALLDQGDAWGVPYACVVADADYGDNPNFLAGLEKRHKRYVVTVRADFPVTLAQRGAPTQRGDAVVAAQKASGWRTIRWRE